MSKNLLKSLLFLVFFNISIACLGHSENFILNGDFKEGSLGWKKYSNFVNGFEVKDWQLKFENSMAIIEGTDCQPQSRVGFRSDKIPLKLNKTQLYKLIIHWEGYGIHRAGIFFFLLDQKDNVMREGYIHGHAGDFKAPEAAHFQVTYQDSLLNPSLVVYIFHDGIGKLIVKKVSLSELSDFETNKIKTGEKIIIKNGENQKSGTPIKNIIIENSYHQNYLAEQISEYPNKKISLLNGEKRFFLRNDYIKLPQDISIIGKYIVQNRDVAKFFNYNIAYNIPFWIEPTDELSSSTVIRILNNSKIIPIESKNPPHLQQLPKSYSAYFYYYGRYRFGNKQEDLSHDIEEMKMIRESGFTGLVIADNYGLDYGRWLDKKNLDPNYFYTIAKAYKEAGFTSPLVFLMLTGVEKGRILWNEQDETMNSYLEAMKPIVAEAASILKGVGLWICPIDEPNDSVRFSFAKRLLDRWHNAFNVPLVITCNGKKARELREICDKDWLKIWVGAGEFPSFELTKKSGVYGFYGGIDSHFPPILFRYLSGIQAWASGLHSQAYWHFYDISGSSDSDFDGKKADFLCIKPNTSLKNPAISLNFLGLQEGLMDLRLLFALEDAAKDKNHPEANEFAVFLEDIRKTILPTDRLHAPWDNAKHFEEFRSKAVDLLSKKD